MATVGVTIAGRTYRMACGEGEEGHLQELARHVDQTLATLRKGFGEIGDNRLVIMTAITVADELSEAKREVARLEEELAGLGALRAESETLRETIAADVATSLDDASERLERIAQLLNDAGKG